MASATAGPAAPRTRMLLEVLVNSPDHVQFWMEWSASLIPGHRSVDIATVARLPPKRLSSTVTVQSSPPVMPYS